MKTTFKQQLLVTSAVNNILSQISESEIIVMLLDDQYRGSAHQDCNLNLQLLDKTPVIFHNLRGCDSHNKQLNINVIQNNMEKYMAFMLGNNLMIIDSLRLMNQSLSNLAKNVPEEALKYTKKVFQGEKLNLMKQKGVYPYDYMDSFEKFEDTQLPTKDAFYSLMHNENITDEKYNHAQNVWNTFKLKKMGEYHDLYHDLRSQLLQTKQNMCSIIRICNCICLLDSN